MLDGSHVQHFLYVNADFKLPNIRPRRDSFCLFRIGSHTWSLFVKERKKDPADVLLTESDSGGASIESSIISKKVI